MDIDAYLRMIEGQPFAPTVRDVLVKAIETAEAMGYDNLMDPSFVLVAVLDRPVYSKLRGRLADAGLTTMRVKKCIRAARPDQTLSQSRTAMEQLFVRALSLASDRWIGRKEGLAISLGDVLLACLTSGSDVIDMLICDELDSSVDTLLVQLKAPGGLVRQFTPDTVEAGLKVRRALWMERASIVDEARFTG